MKKVLKSILLMSISLLIVFSTLNAQNKTPRVSKRQIKQQERIKEGVKSGQLTKGEAVKLEKQHKKIQNDKIKAKSDGVVTAKERAKLTREQNKASKNIYRKKHNKLTR